MTDKEYVVTMMGKSYESGYANACKNIKDALGLMTVPTISIEHAVKLVDIVHNVAKKKNDG